MFPITECFRNNYVDIALPLVTFIPRDIFAVLTSVAAVIISILAILAAVISLITIVIICRG